MGTRSSRGFIQSEGRIIQDGSSLLIENRVFGSNNLILLNNCTVIGDNNDVYGDDATVYGNDNRIYGRRSTAMGARNTVWPPDRRSEGSDVINFITVVNVTPTITFFERAACSDDDDVKFDPTQLKGDVTPLADDQPDSGRVCMICFSNLRDVMCWPCKCLVYCIDCARQSSNTWRRCPHCRLRCKELAVLKHLSAFVTPPLIEGKINILL